MYEKVLFFQLFSKNGTMFMEKTLLESINVVKCMKKVLVLHVFSKVGQFSSKKHELHSKMK